MIEAHVTTVELITKAVPPEFWSQAFAGLLLHLDGDRDEVYKYVQRLLHAYAYRYAPMDIERFDLSEETLYPGDDYDSWEGSVAGTVFIPRRLQWNGVRACDDPTEFRRLMAWSGAESHIKNLCSALRAYYDEIERSVHRRGQEIVCAVHPYGDCASVAAILYGLRDVITENGIKISFKLADWVDLPQLLKESRVDISYASTDLASQWADQYEPTLTRTDPTRIAALCYVRDEREVASAGSHVERIANFNGYYTSQPSTQGDEIIRIRLGERTLTYLAQARKSTADNEAKQILALASARLPTRCVIPTLQGFLWAAEAGLLSVTGREIPTIGTLAVGEVIKEGARGTLGFVVRRKQSDHGEGVARRLIKALERAKDNSERRLASLIFNDSGINAENARRALALWKAPLVSVQGDDSGILARISPEIVFRAALEDGDLFQQELEYRPSWWRHLSRGITTASSEPQRSAG